MRASPARVPRLGDERTIDLDAVAVGQNPTALDTPTKNPHRAAR